MGNHLKTESIRTNIMEAEKSINHGRSMIFRSAHLARPL